MAIKILEGDTRTIEQIKEHYELEKQLAGKLLNSTRAERQHLYTAVYNELFERIPYHPQLVRKADPEWSAEVVGWQIQLLDRFLSPETVFLEVGPGDCSLSLAVAKRTKKVYAVDVSDVIAKQSDSPANFELVLSDGCSVAVPENTVDIAYSNQLMEHLHPDDALDQLRNIHAALRPGGRYICSTPNRLAGPHDVSLYFDKIATGFHLKEYSFTELNSLFRAVGFSKVSFFLRGKEVDSNVLIFAVRVYENILSILPFRMRRAIATKSPLKVASIVIVGTK